MRVPRSCFWLGCQQRLPILRLVRSKDTPGVSLPYPMCLPDSRVRWRSSA